MGYFTERQELIELPSSVDEEEREKIDSFLGLLEDSGMGPQRFKKPSPKKLSKKGARIWAKMDAYRKAKGK